MADSDPIPPGLCACGCGLQTTIIKRTRPHLGLIAGQFNRFRHGHARRRPPYDAQLAAQALCGCGCGLPAPLAKQTHTKRGLITGQPFRFRPGHAMRVKRVDGYLRHGVNVYLHRVRAEESRGSKPLPPSAEIHHPDCDPWNRNARLVICPDHAYHMLLHRRMRVKAVGGNPNTDLLCYRCRKPKPKAEFWRDGRHGYCRACQSEHHREFLARRKAQQHAKVDTNQQDGDTNR